MNKKIRQIFSLLLAVITCFSITESVYAAENTDSKTYAEKNVIGEYTFEISANGTVITRSSVSGYNQKTVTSSSNGIVIECDGQGTGGMGITIKTSSSNGNYEMDFAGAPLIGSASDISGKISTNDEIELNTDLWQSGLAEYFIAFGVPSGVSVLVKVWIYG